MLKIMFVYLSPERWHVMLVSLITFVFLSCSGSDTKPVNGENAAKGQALFDHYRCATCHSVSGKPMYGPHLNGIMDSEIVVYRNGSNQIVKVNRRYLTRSIREPDYEKMVDFSTRKMPVPSITPEEIALIVDYIIYLNQQPESFRQADSGE